MLKNPDHVTVVITELEPSRAFFELLGFEAEIEKVISGDVFDEYMGVDDVEADHVTMVLKGADPRFEIQLLHYRRPTVTSDPDIRNLARPGYNHLCFAVENIEAEVERLRQAGVTFRSELMNFNKRKLIFLEGPEGITIEFAEWD